MEFFRTGNRAHYQSMMYQRRVRFTLLTIGHLLDREANVSSTKYVNEIVDGIWMLLEESTWSYPAHLALQGTADRLPDPELRIVDLNVGEVGKLLAWMKLLLASQFDTVSPVINQRIDYELKRRMFQAYLDIDFGWEGFGDSLGLDGWTVNNWNIWINGNILKTAVFTLEDESLFNSILNKTLYSVDLFLDSYGADGGCEEGAAYWRQAGGRLIEYLQSLMELFSQAKGVLSGNTLFQKIGAYSYKMRIAGNWFVNFADAIPVLTYPPSLLYKYGELFSDDVMKQFAAFMLQYVKKEAVGGDYYREALGVNGDLNEFWNFIETRGKIEKEKPVAPEEDLVWFEDIQVFTARSKGKLFLAGKAGNNHESHNHNDVGNFLLFQNDHPVLIDIGVGTYTAQTFNKSHRYDLFYMQPQFHNCPQINGVNQKAGPEFNAKNVSLVNKDNVVHFAADISGAYPKEAKVSAWNRNLVFNLTENSLILEDEYSLSQFVAPQKLHFIGHQSLKIVKVEGGLELSNDHVNMKADLDWKIWQFNEEVKSLGEDRHLTDVWGETVKRITLTTKEGFKEVKGRFVIKFSSI